MADVVVTIPPALLARMVAFCGDAYRDDPGEGLWNDMEDAFGHGQDAGIYEGAKLMRELLRGAPGVDPAAIEGAELEAGEHYDKDDSDDDDDAETCGHCGETRSAVGGSTWQQWQCACCASWNDHAAEATREGASCGR